MFQSRTYRHCVRHPELEAYLVTVKETNLHVQTPRNYSPEIRDLVIKHRGYLEAYLAAHPQFGQTLRPWKAAGPLPAMVQAMVNAGQTMQVGPMAAVAGAVAAAVGREILQISPQVIIENGGDVYLKTDRPVTLGIYAGSSPLSLKIGLKIDTTHTPKAVCTSSGTLGHSLSLGKADAVCVVSDSGSLADAAATALGNRIKGPEDIGPVLKQVEKIGRIQGVLAVVGETLGVWGDLKIVPLGYGD